MEQSFYKEPDFFEFLVSSKSNIFILENKKEIPFSDFESIRKGINDIEDMPFIFEFDSTKDFYFFTKGNVPIEENDQDVYSEEGVLYEKINYMVINNLSKEDICLNLESNYFEEIHEQKNITTISFFCSLTIENFENIINNRLEEYLRRMSYTFTLEEFIKASKTCVIEGSSVYDITVEENKIKLKRRSLL